MKTGQAGIDLIKSFEGCHLAAYKCPAGISTIGYGHTKNVNMGQKINQAQAEELLRQDLINFEEKVNKYDATYHWTQNEFDALVSFSYNVGSIDNLTANGTRSKAVIAEKILLYDKANGKALPGLKRRREAEKKLFLASAEQDASANQSDMNISSLEYYPKYCGNGILLNALKVCGCNDTSMAFRKKIAVRNNIVQSENAYTGSVSQNSQLLNLLKQGRLLKP